MSDVGKNDQLQRPFPWAPFAQGVMTSPLGRSASECLPEIDWADIMRSHIATAAEKLVRCSYVEDDLVDDMPSRLSVDHAKSLFHPLHAVAAHGRGPPLSLLSNLVLPAGASTSSPRGAAAVTTAVAAAVGGASPAPAAHAAAQGSSGLAPVSWSLAAASAAAADADARARAQPQQSTGAGKNAGFNCNARDGFGRAALHWASSAGRAPWISALIAAGADPNARDSRNVPPLQDAIEAEHASAVRSLLEGGADKNARLSGDISGNENCGGTPLILAAVRGDLEILRLLCDAGASLEDRDAVGFTPLMTAVAHQNLGIAEALLEYGADADTESFRKMTPLMVSVALGNAEITRALLRCGANACHAGVGDLTPLHIAAGRGSADLIEDLLRAGADPSARVANPPPRSTPLHSACRASRLPAVKALLLGGADETMDDMTPPPSAAAGVPGGGGGGGGSDGGGGGGGVVPSFRARPPNTPEDVVGLGTFGGGQNPAQRGPVESLEDYARRRDPRAMDAIRQALRMAPADRVWRRRSWLVMLRASAEAEAEAAAAREKWELSTAKGSLFKIMGSGPAWGKARTEGRVESDAMTEGGGSPMENEGAVVGGGEEVSGGEGSAGGGGGDARADGVVAGGVPKVGGSDEEDYSPGIAAEACKRPRRGIVCIGDGGDDVAASDAEGSGEETKRSETVAGALQSSAPQPPHQPTPECGGGEELPASATRGCGGGEGSAAAAVATIEDGEPKAGCGAGGDGGPAVDDDEIARELRCLCGRLFDVAAVEEGAFRRVVSYL
ncbi:unnamed protein product [Scytosiphon promiscuus]